MFLLSDFKILLLGFYVDATHSDETRESNVEQLASKMQDDILIGVDGSGVKCGVIGELGCSWPLTGNFYAPCPFRM